MIEAGTKKGREKSASDKKPSLLYLDPGVAKVLKLAAVERETSASAIANEAITTWLTQRGFLNPRDEK